MNLVSIEISLKKLYIFCIHYYIILLYYGIKFDLKYTFLEIIIFNNSSMPEIFLI